MLLQTYSLYSPASNKNNTLVSFKTLTGVLGIKPDGCIIIMVLVTVTVAEWLKFITIKEYLKIKKKHWQLCL